MENQKAFEHYLSAEQREQYLEGLDSKKDCIFCAAVHFLKQGKVKDVYVVAVFKHCFLVVNAYPYVPRGHLMAVPKRHVCDYNDLAKEEIDEIFNKAVRGAKSALEKEYKKATGFNIGINLGKHAGASIEHLHIHIVPRYPEEAGFMETTAKTRIVSEHPQTTMKKLAKYFGD